METITAFVTGAHRPTGVGAARALRAAGADVVGFTQRPERPLCRSRAWREVRALESAGTKASVEEILAAAARHGGPIFLLPTEDDVVGELSSVRDGLPDNVRMTLPVNGVVETLLDKTRFTEWARREAFPIPASGIARSKEELEDVLGVVPMPAILKPLVRTPAWQGASPVEKAYRLRTPDDLGKIPFDLFAVAPAYVVSEWIEGGDSDVFFCLTYLDASSEMLAFFTGRKLLQYPRLTGSTAICSDRPDPALEDLTARLFRSAGCQGLASLEVKRSAADGQYYITEPTVGRPNLQSHAAVHAGINLHGIALRHAWGLEFGDLVGPRRRCFWVEERGLFEVLTMRTRVPIPWALIAREMMRARRISSASFSLSDPGPISSTAVGALRKGLRMLRPGRRREALPEGRPAP